MARGHLGPAWWLKAAVPVFWRGLEVLLSSGDRAQPFLATETLTGPSGLPNSSCSSQDRERLFSQYTPPHSACPLPPRFRLLLRNTVMVDTRGSQVRAVTWACLTLSSVATLLRIYCRGWVTKAFSADDWLAVIAQVRGLEDGTKPLSTGPLADHEY